MKAVGEAEWFVTTFLSRTINYLDKIYIDIKCPCYKFQNMSYIYFFIANFSGCYLKFFYQVLKIRKKVSVDLPNVMKQSIWNINNNINNNNNNNSNNNDNNNDNNYNNNKLVGSITQKFVIVHSGKIFLTYEVMCWGSQKYYWIFKAGRARHILSERFQRLWQYVERGKRKGWRGKGGIENR